VEVLEDVPSSASFAPVRTEKNQR